MTAKPKNYIFWKMGVFLFLCVFCFAGASKVFAYKIENTGDNSTHGDFAIGPGKVELEINPGESKTVNITVTNRMGDERVFNFETEDFTGSQDITQTAVLLGDERGPYSLKDYISVPEWSFTLKNGERATVPVTVSIPTDAQPGGLYGSLLTSTASKPNAEKIGPTSTIVARLGTLLFITIPGPVNHDGQLTKFETNGGKQIYASGPIDFRLLYENKGSVYVNPYGKISIKNMLGEEVKNIEVEPWYALPGSLRLREVRWDSSFLVGRYTATASINRGYDNIIDTKSFSFWVIPIKLLAIIVLAIIILLFVLRFVLTRFEIRKK